MRPLAKTTELWVMKQQLVLVSLLRAAGYRM